MAEALGSFYPGGMANPHVEVVTFEGGYYIAPKEGEAEQAMGFGIEKVVPGDDRISTSHVDTMHEASFAARSSAVAGDCGAGALRGVGIVSRSSIDFGRLTASRAGSGSI